MCELRRIRGQGSAYGEPGWTAHRQHEFFPAAHESKDRLPNGEVLNSCPVVPMRNRSKGSASESGETRTDGATSRAAPIRGRWRIQSDGTRRGWHASPTASLLPHAAASHRAREAGR